MKKVLLTTLAILVALPFGFSSSSCAAKRESIVISYAPFQTLALLWTADEQGFFNQNGLDANLSKYDTGAAALDAVLNGEADIAVGAAEFPLVIKALNKERIRIIGTVDKVEHIFLIGRKDRGIEKAADLRGKKVGTTVGTVAEFYLGRLLELNGMNMQDITLVDLKTPPEWVDALVDGDIDAVVTA